MALRRSSMGLANMVAAPSVQKPTGPVCMTCGRTVDKEELVEGYPGETTFAKVRVRHHEADEVRTFDMGSTNWDAGDLGQMMRRANWFDPNSFDSAPLGQVAAPVNDYEDPEPTRAISVGKGVH